MFHLLRYWNTPPTQIDIFNWLNGMYPYVASWDPQPGNTIICKHWYHIILLNFIYMYVYLFLMLSYIFLLFKWVLLLLFVSYISYSTWIMLNIFLFYLQNMQTLLLHKFSLTFLFRKKTTSYFEGVRIDKVKWEERGRL